jgi:phenylpyruvate tautomerase PptA (4-oxalocrotonate tautomerase family)
MPLIEVTFPEGALSNDMKANLAEELTTAVIEMEGAPDNEYVRAVSWCYFNEIPPESIHVGGKRAQEHTYRVVVTNPEGATGLYGPLMARRREEFVKRITDSILAAEGVENTPHESRRVWVHLWHIEDGHCGAFGRILRMPDISAYATGSTELGGEDIVRLREAIDTEATATTGATA